MAASLKDIWALSERTLAVPAQMLGDVALVARVFSWAACPETDSETPEARARAVLSDRAVALVNTMGWQHDTMLSNGPRGWRRSASPATSQ
jgi:hypothetical protein